MDDNWEPMTKKQIISGAVVWLIIGAIAVGCSSKPSTSQHPYYDHVVCYSANTVIYDKIVNDKFVLLYDNGIRIRDLTKSSDVPDTFITGNCVVTPVE